MDDHKQGQVGLMFRIFHSVGRYRSAQSDLASVVGELKDVLAHAAFQDEQKTRYGAALRTLRLQYSDAMTKTVAQHHDPAIIELLYDVRVIAREHLRTFDEKPGPNGRPR